MAEIVNHAGPPDDAKDLVGEIDAAGGRARAVQADVSSVTEMRALFDTAEREFGRGDVLVNNAGIMKLTAVAEVDKDTFDRTIAVNLTGAFNGLRESASPNNSSDRPKSAQATKHLGQRFHCKKLHQTTHSHSCERYQRLGFDRAFLVNNAG